MPAPANRPYKAQARLRDRVDQTMAPRTQGKHINCVHDTCDEKDANRDSKHGARAVPDSGNRSDTEPKKRQPYPCALSPENSAYAISLDIIHRSA
jgi:hypothetical protein